jgi:TonB-linked SusC/RagA family outer membrane protein
LEEPVAGRGRIDVTLGEDSKSLDEVVVTALGIKRQKRSLGYSTTAVGGEGFTQARDLNLGNALSGKIAGVSVSSNATGSTGSSRVVIRGNASITGNNQPLYVIDGVPFDNSNQGYASRWGGSDMGDGLVNINPDDIDNIQVLKGAAASALYGYRGGNGAILITTKSGQKGQKDVSVELNNNLTFNSIYDYRDLQEVYGQGTNGNRPMTAADAEASEQSSWGAKIDGSKAVNFLGKEYSYSTYDNWGTFYNTGINDATSLAVSGASDNIVYRFGISNVYEKSILPNAGFKQQGINMNTTYDITSKLHLSVNANYVFEQSNGRSNLSDANGNTNAALLYHPATFDITWMERETPDSDWGTMADGREFIGSGYSDNKNVYFNNPYWLQYRKTNNMDRNRLTGAMTLRYDITDWLYAQGAIQRDGYTMEYKQVQPIGAAADDKGFMTEYVKTFAETNMNYLIGVNKTLDDWSVGATIGGNRQYSLTKQWMVDGGRPFIVDGIWSVNNLGEHRFRKDYKEYQVNSIYGTADFGWKNQVFLNLTARNDWFSTLSPDNNSYLYPSATLSWVFSDTFTLPDWFTFGKLRGGYAAASNGTSPYQTALAYKIASYSVNGQQIAAVNSSTYPSANLKPVRISEFEVGMNLAFLKSRLTFDFAYYKKNTKDDIAEVSTSKTSGFDYQVANVGEVENSGFEFMVNAVPVHNRDFSWSTTLNFALNNSEVIYLGEDVERLAIKDAQSNYSDVLVYNVVGKSYGEIVGYKYKRHNGQIVYENGVPQHEDEVSELGSGVHKLTGGWNNRFTYKDFTFDFLVDFKFGGKLFSGTERRLTATGQHKQTLEGRENSGSEQTFVGEGVMDDGNGNYVKNNVAVTAQTYWSGVSQVAEEFIYDASFIKLRELSLGYSIPQSILGKQSFVKGLNVSLVARNLWTILKYTDNIDPETSINNTNGQGLEMNGYPATRNIGFNVNIKF